MVRASGDDARPVDLGDGFRVDGHRPAVIGNVMVYRDTELITGTYAGPLGEERAERVDEAHGS